MWQRHSGSRLFKSLRQQESQGSPNAIELERPKNAKVTVQVPAAPNGPLIDSKIKNAWLGSPWLLALLTGAIAASSVWVVGALAGVVAAGADDDRDLVVRIELPKSDQLRPVDATQEVLYPSIELNTFLTIRPLGISEFETLAPTDEWSKKVMAGGAGVVVTFWKDKAFKVPASVVPTTNQTLHLNISVNRELQEEVRIENQTKFIFSKSSLKGPSISQFAKPPLHYEVDCPLVSNPQIGEGRRDQMLQYGCPVKFKRSLNAAKGFAQFDWTQTLQTVQLEIDHRLTSTVYFDPEYYDARVSPFDELDSEPKVSYGTHTGDYYSHAKAKAQTTHKAPSADASALDKISWNNHPAGFSIHGINSKKKDLVDLVSFILAALFGAAIASLTELASTALKRKSGKAAD